MRSGSLALALFRRRFVPSRGAAAGDEAGRIDSCAASAAYGLGVSGGNKRMSHADAEQGAPDTGFVCLVLLLGFHQIAAEPSSFDTQP